MTERVGLDKSVNHRLRNIARRVLYWARTADHFGAKRTGRRQVIYGRKMRFFCSAESGSAVLLSAAVGFQLKFC